VRNYKLLAKLIFKSCCSDLTKFPLIFGQLKYANESTAKWTRTTTPKMEIRVEGAIWIFDRSSGCPLPQGDTNVEIQMER